MIYRIAAVFVFIAIQLSSFCAGDKGDTQAMKELLIPIRFTLPEDGFVTLVIEDKDGRRVRNLVSETPFPKGENIAWWDGMNDLGRDVDAAKHGVYRIPSQMVQPGEYHVRGLWRKDIDLKYEFSVYSQGNPPWKIEGGAGAWLANHTPPQSALFVPAEKSPAGQPVVYLGAYITEGPDGLIWVDLEGRKLGGKKWLGGTWTAAPYLAGDHGSKADPAVIAYAASVGKVDYKDKNSLLEVRITALTRGADKLVLKKVLENPPDRDGKMSDEIGGLAVHDGVLVCGLTRANKLLYVSAAETAGMKPGTVIGTVSLDSPKGLVFDAKGQLFAISGRKLVAVDRTSAVKEPKVLIAEGLEEPIGVTLDAEGNIYVSDQGNSHQVKVFTPAGKFIRAIGNAGVPKAGPYDPLHMNNPSGVAIDSNRRLWVAEQDFLPKRVSVWSLDGKLVNAFYGPPKYGAGGTIDPADKTRFYYTEESSHPGMMEFRLDWDKGTSRLVNVLCRPSPGDMRLPFRSAAPETAMYRDVNGKKQRYFTNCYNCSPTNGHGTAFVFIERDNVLYPVAGMGRGSDWKELFLKDAFKGLVPEGAFDSKGEIRNPFFFIWSDLNSDCKVQPEEVAFQKGVSGGVTVLPDFSFCVSRFGADKEPKRALRFKVCGFTDGGVPKYDFSKGLVLAGGVEGPASSGGDQVLEDNAGNVIVTLGAAPFSRYSISGGRNGIATWSYPSLWPGLHASHESPKPDRPGELIGTTRLLGGFVTPKGTDAGPLFALNGNMGNTYLFTSDGLFVATLFEDMRLGKPWRMPLEQRGMSLKGITPHDEHFWPTINQTSDGEVYLVYGKDTSALVKLVGLDTVRRIADSRIQVTADSLEKAQKSVVESEAKRIQGGGQAAMRIPIVTAAPALDGKIDGWPGDWVQIDRSGTKAYFNSNSKPYDIKGSVVVADGKLFAAWQTGDGKLLNNSGEMPLAPFKTGGALDLMIGTNPGADLKRGAPAEGDLRLTVTQVKGPSTGLGTGPSTGLGTGPSTGLGTGRTFAVLYRPVAPGAGTPKVPFSSPWRTISFDRVEDVSDKVRLASDGAGNYEISVPLDVLGLAPKPGMKIKGDIGILRGDGSETLARTYWSNKATAIVSDVPSEAELAPKLWGTWEFSAK